MFDMLKLRKESLQYVYYTKKYEILDSTNTSVNNNPTESPGHKSSQRRNSTACGLNY